MAHRIKKDSSRVPEGFTLSMAVLDCLPVLFFSISAFRLAMGFQSVLFRIGIFFIILAGALKVSWKMVIALAKKNIPILSRQMRIVMPFGFILSLLALFLSRAEWSFHSILDHFTRLPSLFFFIVGIAGIFVMVRFAATKDRLDARSNWNEQAVNGITQGEVIALLNYMNQILLALLAVALLVTNITKMYACAGRINEVFDIQHHSISPNPSESRPKPRMSRIIIPPAESGYHGALYR